MHLGVRLETFHLCFNCNLLTDDCKTFYAIADEIDNDCKDVFSDVMDEYCTVRGIISKLESWRETDMDAYTEAYVSLCIPKMISPIISLQLITWNPIMVLH